MCSIYIQYSVYSEIFIFLNITNIIWFPKYSKFLDNFKKCIAKLDIFLVSWDKNTLMSNEYKKKTSNSDKIQILPKLDFNLFRKI